MDHNNDIADVTLSRKCRTLTTGYSLWTDNFFQLVGFCGETDQIHCSKIANLLQFCGTSVSSISVPHGVYNTWCHCTSMRHQVLSNKKSSMKKEPLDQKLHLCHLGVFSVKFSTITQRNSVGNYCFFDLVGSLWAENTLNSHVLLPRSSRHLP